MTGRTVTTVLSTVKNSESPFGDQSLRAGGTGLLAAAGGKQRSAGAKVVAAAPSDE